MSPTRNDSMKRPTKSFVVEVKRSARKSSGFTLSPRWDVTAALQESTAASLARSSQATASAIFQARNDATPANTTASDPPPPVRRILPVIVMEAGPALEAIRITDPLDSAVNVSEAAQRKPPRRKTKTPERVGTPAAPIVIASLEPVSPGFDPDVAGVLALPAAANAERRERGRPSDREDSLPRGERWKRRLPKFMR